MRSFRRIIVLCVMITVTVFPLMAEGAEEQAEEVIELTVWFGRDSFVPGDEFERFEANHPNIRVNYDVIPLEEAVAEFSRAADAGRAPDIVQVGANAVGPLVSRGLLRDMTDMFERWQNEDPELYNDIADWGWTLAEFQGTPYGLGVHGGTNGSWMVYRKDVLAELGYDGAPETWAELIEIARDVRDSDFDMTPFSHVGSRVVEPLWFYGPFMAMGGQYIDDVPQIDSEAGRRLVEVHQTLASENLTSTEVLSWETGQMRAAFIGGNAAMAPIGWNIFPSIQEELEYGVEWDQAPMPARRGAEDEAERLMIGWPYYVNNGTEHPYEVSLLLRYLADPDIVIEVAKRYQPASTLSVLESSEYREAKPWAAETAQYFTELAPLPVHPRGPELEEVWKDLLQQSLSDFETDPAAMVREAQAQIDEVVGN